MAEPMKTQSRKLRHPFLKKLCWLVAGCATMASFLAIHALSQVALVEVHTNELPQEPLKQLNTSYSFLRGKLVYIAAVHFKGEVGRRKYLITRQVGAKSEDVNGSNTLRAKIPVNVPEVIFDPEFSQDGQYIVFKSGWPYDDLGTYSINLWDTKNKKSVAVLPSNTALTYRYVKLSPNNKSLIFYFGGDSNGNDLGSNRTFPLQLNVIEIGTKKITFMLKNPATKFATWTQQGTLLYSSIDENTWQRDFLKPGNETIKAQEDESIPHSSSEVRDAIRPDIYEVQADGGKPKLIIHDGYMPVASPDGKWIACFSSTFTFTEREKLGAFSLDYPKQSILCIFNRATRKKVLLEKVWGTFPSIIWTPDSKKLIVMRSEYKQSQGKAFVYYFDIAHGNIFKRQDFVKKNVATLQAEDGEHIDWGIDEKEFSLKSVSRDSSYLFIATSEVSARKFGETFLNETKTLSAINIGDGSVTSFAKIYNWQASSLGLDWFDESSF